MIERIVQNESIKPPSKRDALEREVLAVELLPRADKSRLPSPLAIEQCPVDVKENQHAAQSQATAAHTFLAASPRSVAVRIVGNRS